MQPDSSSDRPRDPAPDRPAGHTDREDGDPDAQSPSTPEPDGKRVAEAGNAYTGRMMDDRLKTNPRVEDEEAGAGTEEDE